SMTQALLVSSGRRFTAGATSLAFSKFLFLRPRIVLGDFALLDSNLVTAGAVRGGRKCESLVYSSAERRQWDAPFAIPFHARDFCAAKASRAVDADAFGAKTHRRLHRALHGAAECNTTFELLRDRFCDQLGVKFGLTDFHDIDDDVAVGELGD